MSAYSLILATMGVNMKSNVTEYDFRRAFETIRPDNFSYQGLGAMYEWFESYEDDTGEEIELDVIAICCDFCEYTLDELESEYSSYVDMPEPEANIELDPRINVSPLFWAKTNEWLIDMFGSVEPEPLDADDWSEALNDHTIVIPVNDDTLIIQGF